MTIKTIIFDLGGVFVELDITKFFKKVFAPFQLSKPKTPFMLKFFKQSDIYHKGQIDNQEFYELACDILNLDKDHITLTRFYDAFNSILTKVNKDMVKILEKLRKSEKYKLFCLSNINQSHWDYLQNIDCHFLSYFDEILLSHEIQMLKPSPEVFEYAIKKAGCSPEEVVFIDDGRKNVQSAEKLGIIGITFNSVNELKTDMNKLGIRIT